MMKRSHTLNIIVAPTETPNGESKSLWDIECMDRDKGLLEIGCHYLIDTDGDSLVGRKRDTVGNYHPDMDGSSVIIKVVGSTQFNPAQEAAVKGLVSYLQEVYPEAEELNTLEVTSV